MNGKSKGQVSRIEQDPEIAIKLKTLLESGMNVTQALVQCGYSPAYASSKQRRKSKSLQAVITQAREEYLGSYLQSTIRTGLSGESAGKRVAEIALNGKDFDALQAIRFHRDQLNAFQDARAESQTRQVFALPITVNVSDFNQRASQVSLNQEAAKPIDTQSNFNAKTARVEPLRVRANDEAEG